MWKVGHFHRDCLRFRASAQSRESTNIVKGQVTHNLTASLPVTDMVLKSPLKELMSAKVAKKYYKQKYQQVKASMEPTAALPVTTREATITDPTPAVTTASIAAALKQCRTTPATKPKVVVFSTLLASLVRQLVILMDLLRTPG